MKNTLKSIVSAKRNYWKYNRGAGRLRQGLGTRKMGIAKQLVGSAKLKAMGSPKEQYVAMQKIKAQPRFSSLLKKYRGTRRGLGARF